MILKAVLLMYFLNQSTSSFYSPDVSTYELFYSDLTKLENFFVFSNSSKADTNDGFVEVDDSKRRPVGELLAKLERLNEQFPMDGVEAQELNMITKVVSNLTRRQRHRPEGGKEPIAYKYDYDDWYDNKRKPTESRKKMMLVMISLQYLIHTRVKIKEAIRFRNIVKKDKRYRLGYLFNRMRRLAIEQRKVVTSVEENRLEHIDLNNLYSMIRMYEKVVRYDVDMRDTRDLIRRTYAERADIDKLY